MRTRGLIGVFAVYLASMPRVVRFAAQSIETDVFLYTVTFKCAMRVCVCMCVLRNVHGCTCDHSVNYVRPVTSNGQMFECFGRVTDRTRNTIVAEAVLKAVGGRAGV